MTTSAPAIRVGVVGGGQLARMMGDEARRAGVELTVLATSPDDSASATADHLIIGGADDEEALGRLRERVDVITFDHELVDLDLLGRLEADGVILRPSASALRFSVDKAVQRADFAAAGLPVPEFTIISDPAHLGDLEHWTRDHGAPPVLKLARGGYDGKGVLFPADDREALAMTREMLERAEVVVEERVALLGEVAQLVVRSVEGDVASYPLVSTIQSQGMCTEVRYPAQVPHDLEERARVISSEIARHIGLVGVMAVEFFVCERGLLINELALRPHNSGHWTIEGTATSQFANHLLAVSGQPLGSTAVTCHAAVMVNVVGADSPGSLDAARSVSGAMVHDYGKSWRPGRKLGHVTALAFGDDDTASAHVTAWKSARAYGTTTREA
ncbi:MAG: 5-(carboxyamino)imidazole ribonucleotide synthase [Acidobacteria bacterium]|nr:5-(carboxyamino)imidazole ribonucleotide synthase [Acidobacteriota bacterium]